MLADNEQCVVSVLEVTPGKVCHHLGSGGSDYMHLEYDPFGNLTGDKNNTADDAPYLFSTKPRDLETGLYYYGFRYYDPVTGRWASRDPIEEKGGLNLYAFVANDSADNLDVLGGRRLRDEDLLQVWCFASAPVGCRCITKATPREHTTLAFGEGRSDPRLWDRFAGGGAINAAFQGWQQESEAVARQRALDALNTDARSVCKTNYKVSWIGKTRIKCKTVHVPRLIFD